MDRDSPFGYHHEAFLSLHTFVVEPLFSIFVCSLHPVLHSTVYSPIFQFHSPIFYSFIPILLTLISLFLCLSHHVYSNSSRRGML